LHLLRDAFYPASPVEISAAHLLSNRMPQETPRNDDASLA